MIGIYADESESHSPNIFTIAGWFAPPSAWDRLRAPWMEMLRTIGPNPVSALHMKDLTPDPPKGEFAGWTREKRDALIVGAVDLLVGERSPISNLYAVGTTIDVDEWERIGRRIGEGPASKEETYLFLYHGFLMQSLLLPVATNGLDFIFDTRKGIQGEALQYFTHTKNAVERHIPGKVGGIAFMDDKDEPALQAADLLSYELRRRVWQRTVRPDRPPRRSYQRLKEGAALRSFRCYDSRFSPAFNAHVEAHREEIERLQTHDEMWMWARKATFTLDVAED